MNALNATTIGLFGTCGASRWRERFIALYEQHGIAYYNPQVAEGTWDPDQAVDEAWHLANDALVLFPITEETLALGSLAETGFSSSARWNGMRFVIIYVAPDVAPALYADNKAAADGSRRARKLVREHLQKVENPNVFVVQSLQEMLEVSVKLWASLQLIHAARQPQTHCWEDAVQSSAWGALTPSAARQPMAA